MLEYNLPGTAKLDVVDPVRTSQTCSACQPIDAASRISRSSFVCTQCRTMFDTDVNAAKNIFAIGINPTEGLPGIDCGSSRAADRKKTPARAEARPFRAESSHPASIVSPVIKIISIRSTIMVTRQSSLRNVRWTVPL
jgi:hypothetical protein